MRHRSYCYTWNNFPEEIDWSKFNFQYNVFGIETGESGTTHLQGYMEFKNPKNIKTLHKIEPKIHWEPRYGSQKQAIDYCKKDGKWTEDGDKKNQGERNDLKKFVEIAKTEGMKAIFEQEDIPNFQTIRVCEKMLEYCEEPRQEKPEVIWIHGEPGIGKTKLAHTMCPNAYIKDETKWWSGYDGNTEVIIDDFRPKHMSFTYLLKLIDRYQMRVETKGGFRQFKAKKIIITSVESPLYMWHYKTTENLKQLSRRIDDTIDLNTKVEGNTGFDSTTSFRD